MTAKAAAPVVIKTRIFDYCGKKYANLCDLAHAMGISVSQIYRVREGKRSINQKFIIGAIKAFPERKFEDLFYLVPKTSAVTDYRHNHQRKFSSPQQEATCTAGIRIA